MIQTGEPEESRRWSPSFAPLLSSPLMLDIGLQSRELDGPDAEREGRSPLVFPARHGCPACTRARPVWGTKPSRARVQAEHSAYRTTAGSICALPDQGRT